MLTSQVNTITLLTTHIKALNGKNGLSCAGEADWFLRYGFCGMV